jgi:hypothetical protein
VVPVSNAPPDEPEENGSSTPKEPNVVELPSPFSAAAVPLIAIAAPAVSAAPVRTCTARDDLVPFAAVAS